MIYRCVRIEPHTCAMAKSIWCESKFTSITNQSLSDSDIQYELYVSEGRYYKMN